MAVLLTVSSFVPMWLVIWVGQWEIVGSRGTFWEMLGGGGLADAENLSLLMGVLCVGAVLGPFLDWIARRLKSLARSPNGS